MNVKIDGTTNVKRDDWVNPSPAHDAPAAQLRERLAGLERTIQMQKEEINRLLRIADERDSFRAEADRLREQVADEDARWHTLSDGYAGAMAELTSLRNFVAAYDAWVADDNTVWGNKFGELVLAREALQPAPRPDAQEETR